MTKEELEIQIERSKRAIRVETHNLKRYTDLLLDLDLEWWEKFKIWWEGPEECVSDYIPDRKKFPILFGRLGDCLSRYETADLTDWLELDLYPLLDPEEYEEQEDDGIDQAREEVKGLAMELMTGKLKKFTYDW